MIYVLDTNACIGWLRKNQTNLVDRIAQESPTDIMICSVVVGELLFGVEHSAVTHRDNSRRQVELLRRQFASVPFNDSAAEQYGNLRAYLTRVGMMIGSNDLLIATIALANDLTLVTHNIAEFQRVPNLVVEDWETVP